MYPSVMYFFFFFYPKIITWHDLQINFVVNVYVLQMLLSLISYTNKIHFKTNFNRGNKYVVEITFQKVRKKLLHGCNCIYVVITNNLI